MNRRSVIALGLGFPSWAFGPNDFWNKKEAAEWSEDEIKKLLMRSPWAKEITVEMNLSAGGGGARQGGKGGGRSGGGGGGRSGGGEGGMGEGGMGGMGGGGGPQIKAFIRWESAMPVWDAHRKPRVPAWADYYVLSVSGLPGGGGAAGGRRNAKAAEGPAPDPEQRRKAMEARMKESTRLVVKGRDPVAPAEILRPREGSSTLVLFFPRKDLPITAADKDVTFATKVGPLDLKVKFPLKDMVYRGELAL